jgi:hypothetical protein
MKVLFEKKVTLQPVSTTEGSVTQAIAPTGSAQAIPFPSYIPSGIHLASGPPAILGHNQRIKLSFPWSKTVAFDWEKPVNPTTFNTSAIGGQLNQTEPNNFQLNQGFTAGTPIFNKRTYLTVRALNPCTTVFIGTPTPINPGNTPSMDVKLRNTWCSL